MKKEQFELALRDPSQVFKTPQELVENDDLSSNEKVDLLRRWAYDQLELSVAEEENMGASAPHPALLLDEILQALHQLGAELPLEKLKASKQGGV